MQDTSGLISIAEASRRLSRCYGVVRDMVARGKLSGVIVGGRWFVREESVARHLQARELERPDPAVPA